MPFVRVSRDKRGYETIFLVHVPNRRGRSGPARVLYAFRTPPGVKVGRDPFDDGIRRALEAAYPDVEFDWTKLSNIPPPPPDTERWRERRRAERAARQARRADEEERAEPDPESGDRVDAAHAADDVLERAERESPVPSSGSEDAAAAGGSEEAVAAARKKRRRRRRGRRPQLSQSMPALESHEVEERSSNESESTGPDGRPSKPSDLPESSE